MWPATGHTNEGGRRIHEAEAELSRIRALLADEGTVETVAQALGRHREDSTYPDSCVCEDVIPDRPNGSHYPAHAARAALDALAVYVADTTPTEEP